ncbi:metallophosphoesterase, partial [Macellibacteroides fermentans]
MRRISYMLILCLSILYVQAKDFRFALFTDLHITHSTPAVEDLQRAVDQVNATSGIDFVLVSGDITEEGDLASLQKAKSILDKLKVPYYITSGNHETKWSESGCTDFNKVFGSDRFRFEHNGYLFLGFNSGPVMRMADGHVAPQDISWLKQELTKAGAEKPVILVSHYPLQDGDVDNWYEVTDAVRPFNIKVILGGHYHSNRQLFYDGIPGLLNRSTLRAKADAGGYSIYQVTNDSIVVSEQTIGGEPKRWAGVSLTNTYYTADNSTYKRPDFSVNKSYPQVKMGWSAATGKGIYSSPVVYNNSVYVGDDLGELSCYTLKEGKLKWTFKSNARIVGTPDAGNGV